MACPCVVNCMTVAKLHTWMSSAAAVRMFYMVVSARQPQLALK